MIIFLMGQFQGSDDERLEKIFAIHRKRLMIFSSAYAFISLEWNASRESDRRLNMSEIGRKCWRFTMCNFHGMSEHYISGWASRGKSHQLFLSGSEERMDIGRKRGRHFFVFFAYFFAPENDAERKWCWENKFFSLFDNCANFLFFDFCFTLEW